MGTTVGAKVVTEVDEGKEMPGPGAALWSKVRGGLISRGWSDFTSWCRAEELDPKRVKHALFGLSDTEEARELRARAMRAAGLLEEK